jgi:hypothetical protein
MASFSGRDRRWRIAGRLDFVEFSPLSLPALNILAFHGMAGKFGVSLSSSFMFTANIRSL